MIAIWLGGSLRQQALAKAFVAMTYIFVSLLSLQCLAQNSGFSVPKLTGPVVDQAQILSAESQSSISSLLRSLKDSGGSQVQVLTVADLGGLTIEEASIQVTNSWGLGAERQDNGVLLLVAPYDRQVRIEVGQGLEGDLTDAYSKRIIDQAILPNFRRGDFNQGVLQGVLRILKHTDPKFDLASFVSESDLPKTSNSSSKEEELPLGLKIFLLLAIIVFVFGRKNGLSSASGYYGGRGGFGGGGGFGGRGGGGGWSGGGGGFSGGGASGRW